MYGTQHAYQFPTVVVYSGRQDLSSNTRAFPSTSFETQSSSCDYIRVSGPHPLPALLLAPFFARCLTLVPRSLLLNRTEMLATQVICNLNNKFSMWKEKIGIPSQTLNKYINS